MADAADMPAFDPSLLRRLREAGHVVVFTGAGASAESGIATFRDALTGLWSRFDPMRLASPEGFAADPSLVWGWYEARRAQARRASPNGAHTAVAALAARVARLDVVTQNVDDLHERAGSRDVAHLHGSLHAARCFDCATPHPLPDGVAGRPLGRRADDDGNGDGDSDDGRVDPPRCAACGGPVRPGVVWFGEALPGRTLDAAFAAARDCDVLLAVGTSGVVQPAASIPWHAADAGAAVVQVNPGPSELDAAARWNLRGAAGLVLPALLAAAFGD